MLKDDGFAIVEASDCLGGGELSKYGI